MGIFLSICPDDKATIIKNQFSSLNADAGDVRTIRRTTQTGNYLAFKIKTTHTHIYIYIYIYSFVSLIGSDALSENLLD
jgi:hypothetical protein